MKNSKKFRAEAVMELYRLRIIEALDLNNAKEFDEICQRVQDLMQWDVFKATTWMKTLNPFLGNVSPMGLIRIGRGHKVMSFIDGAQSK